MIAASPRCRPEVRKAVAQDADNTVLEILLESPLAGSVATTRDQSNKTILSKATDKAANLAVCSCPIARPPIPVAAPNYLGFVTPLSGKCGTEVKRFMTRSPYRSKHYRVDHDGLCAA
jgi:hypothetical protein